MITVNGWAMSVWRGTAEEVFDRIVASKEHRLSISREMIETSTTSRARSYLPGRVGWKITVSGILTTDKLPSVGERMNVCVRIGIDYFIGTAIVESIERNFALKQCGAYSLSMQGSGDLDIFNFDNDAFAYYFGKSF